MDRVDREITMVEQQISKLKKKQVSREDRKGIPVKAGAWPHVSRCPESCDCLFFWGCVLTLEASRVGTHLNLSRAYKGLRIPGRGSSSSPGEERGLRLFFA